MEPSILERAEHPISRHDIDANVLKVLYRLINADHIAYLVGGGVRDLMMGRRPKDFDVATSAHPQQVRELFRNSRLIGRRFRLVHVFFGPQNIEVATFRRRSEEVPDSGDPMIQHDNTFGSPEEDAFRRDFTVNALFYDPRTFRVIDYVGGVADLRARLIRTIGDPELRMREDPVRMIRAVRFAAKLGFEIEPTTRAAIEQHCRDLAKASIPRLVEETFRTLSLADAARAFIMLRRLGLLETMLPLVSDYLGTAHGDVERSAVVRHLGALGEAIATGFDPTHAVVLAVIFADVNLTAPRDCVSTELTKLVDALRMRGFSRADTENMRLLLHSLAHMFTPSRITRRLARRPYFDQARQIYGWLAPHYGGDIGSLDTFLSAPARHQALHRPPREQHAPGDARGAPAPHRARRRRRRGGRRRPNSDSSGVHSHAAAEAEAPSTLVTESAGSSSENTVPHRQPLVPAGDLD